MSPREKRSGADRATPHWLREPCPRWCVREHAEGDHPDDRYHQSEASIVPAVVAAYDTAPVTASLEGMEMVAWIGRYVGDLVDWMVLEPIEHREPRLVLTVESARALHRGLTEQLDRHAEG